MSKPTWREIVEYLFNLDKTIIINNVMYRVIKDYDVFEVETYYEGFSRTTLFNNNFNIKEQIDCDSEGNNVVINKIYYGEYPVSIITDNGCVEEADYAPRPEMLTKEYKRFFELTQTRGLKIIFDKKICDVKINDNKTFNIVYTLDNSVIAVIGQKNMQFDYEGDLEITFDGKTQLIQFIDEWVLKYTSEIE